jgi:predicted aldo/keto reductase-like oxidoreductase
MIERSRLVPVVRTRPLGKTGFDATEIGLGGIPIIGIPFEKAIRIVHRALDRGINYIDTARAYGDSEAKIGAVMRTRRDECFLATKTHAASAKEAREHLETSLRELQTDYVDLWQLHDVSTRERFHNMTKRRGTLEAAKRAQREGKCRFIGVSSHNNDLLLEIMDLGEIDTILCVYNLGVHGTGERVIPTAKEKGIGVVVMKPLSGGIFFRRKDSKITPRDAWRFVLGNPDISVALAGAKLMRDVEQAVRASRTFKPLTKAEERRLIKAAQSLGEDICRNCGYCRDCPQGIPIPAIMQLYDDSRVYPYEWPRHRTTYATLSPQADACEECGKCVEACPFDLPIMDRLKEAHRRFSLPA